MLPDIAKAKDKEKKQIELAKSLDALVVLGGESEARTRTGHAYFLYSKAEQRLKIVLTGYCNGLLSEPSRLAESRLMKDYLIEHGIPSNDLFSEEKSKDTLANLIFAWPILDYLNAKSIGLVTDSYHMDRSLWTAEKVYGDNFSIHPLPARKTTSLTMKIMELAIKYALMHDLRDIRPGDMEALEHYLHTKHPFHAENPPMSIYKLGVDSFKKTSLVTKQ